MRRWFSFALFLSIVLAVFGGLHYYLYSRIASWVDGGIPLATAFAVFAVLPVGSRITERFSRSQYVPVWWLAACWMGVAFYLLVFLLAGHFVEAAVAAAGAWPGDHAKPWTVGVPVVLAAATSLAALYQGNRRPRVSEVEVTLDGLGPAAEGATIVHISDVHVGSLVGEGKVRALVDQLRALEPDIVVITGDLVDERPEKLAACGRHLAELRGKLGTYAVTGNHEFYSGVAESVAWMKRAGIRVLSNEVVEPVEGLLIAGFHDPTGVGWGDARFRSTREDIEAVLQGREGGKATVVLYHQPVRVGMFERAGVDLLLCGHTHGGQLWPFRYLTALRYRHTQGMYREGNMQVYVCRGTATWGPPMRLPGPPEIVRFRLRRFHHGASTSTNTGTSDEDELHHS